MSRWPKHNPWFWETAPFARLLLPLVAGIVVYGTKPDGNTILLLVICAIAILYVITGIATKAVKKGITSFFISTVLLISGYCIASLNDVTNDIRWFGKGIGSRSVCQAVLTAPPAEKERSYKLTVEVIKVIFDSIPHLTKGAAIVYIHKDGMPMLYHKGDTVLMANKWQPIQNAGNPYEFDHAQYCRNNNIYLQQFCNSGEVRLYALANSTQLSFTERLHNYCMATLERYIPDPKTRGLIQDMLLGDDVNMDPDLRKSFTDTGIVHIIAISGGNVMMFFIVIGWLMSWLKHRRHKWISYVVALPLVWIYVVMAGASPSAIRAAVMFSALALGFVMNKENNALNQLLATAFVLLCAQPNWLYSLGFQLSFVAVLSLILFYSPVHRLYRPGFNNKLKQWIAKKLWETLCASFAAEVLVAPLCIYYFHSFPVMFLVANVLAFFFMFAVLILGIGIIVFSSVPMLATLIGQLDMLIVQYFNSIISALQLFSPPSFQYMRLTFAELVFVYAIIGSVGVLLILRNKKGLFVALGACSVLMASLTISRYYSLQQDHLVVYNTPGAPHVERITADKYVVLTTDTAQAKRIGYATQPTHVEEQAWQQQTASTNCIFLVQGKRILILDTPATTGQFHVDRLVINYHSKPNIALLKKIYTPNIITIGNNYNRKELEQWHIDAVKEKVMWDILAFRAF